MKKYILALLAAFGFASVGLAADDVVCITESDEPDLSRAYISWKNATDLQIWGEVSGLNGVSSFVVNFYTADNEKIASTTLKQEIPETGSLSWHLRITGAYDDEYWRYEWVDGHPTPEKAPATAEFVINGKNWGSIDITYKHEVYPCHDNWADYFVAEYNGVYYFLLQDVINAGATNIKLLANVNEKGTEVESGSGEFFVQILGKDVTIDLNGKTLTGSLYLDSDAKLTIDNGSIVSFEGNKSSCIESVGGTLVLGAGLNAHSGYRHAIRVKGGTAAIAGGTYKTTATSNITAHALYVSHASTVTVEGGTFTGSKGFSTSGNAVMVADNDSKVEIKGGTFSNAAGPEGCICAAAGLVLTGGMFDTWSYDKYLTEGKCVDLNGDNLYEVVDAIVQNTTTGKMHGSLQAAIDAAAAGDQLKVLADIEEAPITVADGRDVTIDLDKNTIIGRFWINGTATIQNGTIVNTNTGKSAIETNASATTDEAASGIFTPVLTVANLAITSARHAIRVDGGTVTIQSGTYQTTAPKDETAHGINISSGATVVIVDGTFIGGGKELSDSAAVASRGDGTSLTIKGGTFSGGTTYDLNAWGGSIVVEGGSFGTARMDAGEIKGGYFESEVYGVRAITGGTFKVDPAAKVVSGYASQKIAEGEYAGWFEIVRAVAQIGEQGYASLDAALKVAKSGDTVTILKGDDITWAKDFVLTEGVILKLGEDVATPTAPNGYVWENKSLVKVTNWIQVADTAWYDTPAEGVDGSATAPYVITTAEQLAGLAKLVNAGTDFTGKVITLANEEAIDLDKYEWTAVGTSDKPFAGSVTGGVVNNLTITGTNHRQGLFGVVSGATLQGLKVNKIQVSGGYYVGGLVGYATGATVVKNCHVDQINLVAAAYAGGLIGFADKGSSLIVTDNTVSNVVIQGTYAAGIAGYVSNTPAQLVRCQVLNVNIEGDGYCIAGIVGGMDYNKASTLEDCHVSGNIQLRGTGYVAGIIPYNKYCVQNIKNCSVIGGEGTNSKIQAYFVNSDTGYQVGGYIGGIVGWNPEEGGNTSYDVTDCTVKNLTIEAGKRVGAIAGIIHYGSVLSNLTVEDVAIVAHGDPATLSAGLIVGEKNVIATASPVVIYNYTLNNVTLNNAPGPLISNINNANGTVEGFVFACAAPTFDDAGKVTGGTFEVFDKEIAAKTILAPAALWKANADGTYTVYMSEAKVGETYYATLQEAINVAVAADATDRTVVLQQDITDDVRIEYIEMVRLMTLTAEEEETTKPALTLDMNGYDINATVTIPADVAVELALENSKPTGGTIDRLIVETVEATVTKTDAVEVTNPPSGSKWEVTEEGSTTQTLTTNYLSVTLTSNLADAALSLNGGGTTFIPDSETTLVATANDGYVFVGWSGDVVSATNLTISVTGHLNAVANFIPSALYSEYEKKVVADYTVGVAMGDINIAVVDGETVTVGIQLQKAISLEGTPTWTTILSDDLAEVPTIDTTTGAIQLTLPIPTDENGNKEKKAFFKFIPKNDA